MTFNQACVFVAVSALYVSRLCEGPARAREGRGEMEVPGRRINLMFCKSVVLCRRVFQTGTAWYPLLNTRELVRRALLSDTTIE